MRKNTTSFLNPALLGQAILDAFIKLKVTSMIKNPVMFVTYVGAILCTSLCLVQSIKGHPNSFEWQIALWLWLTIIFANWAESLAEGRGKAQAESLKKNRTILQARYLKNGLESLIPATQLREGDIVVCEAGDFIPADGDVIDGIASVDESAITGESAPVIRESGGDRCAVTGGTRVISDRIVIQVSSNPGDSFLDHIIALIENSKRNKTPNEIALGIVLSAFSLILLLAVGTLPFFWFYTLPYSGETDASLMSVPVLTALLVCLIPTTIGGLLSAIGIAGMDRLVARNIIAKSGRAIEAAGDIDVMLIDKTGTITFGNRMAHEFIPSPGIEAKQLAQAAQLASLADETPEGRSIVILAKEHFSLRADSLSLQEAQFIPFSAQTRMSGIDFMLPNGSACRIRKGAIDAIKAHAEIAGFSFPEELQKPLDIICRQGGTPLLVSENGRILGLIHLKDVVKNGISERFAQLRKMGIRTIMITGDNPITAAAIAAEAGVDDFVAQSTPESKLKRIKDEQAAGHLVAMTGDGTNDAPALAQADVAVAMNTGTQAAREAGNLIDLDSNPTKIIEIVEVGKQLLMTRGALTTFSIANDLAKYFAILPALFGGLYAFNHSEGPLASLNVMALSSPKSAILSAIIFNAVIIVALIPLALKGISYRAENSMSLLRRNVLLYGLSGIISPFIGIKLIDMLIVAIGLV